MIWCIKTYIIAYIKIQKNENILSSMSNLQPNWCLKIEFQKVDQHAGGKWLINIVSGNGLVPSGNKALPEPILTQIFVAKWRH